MSAPEAGRLRRRVTLEAPADVADDIGGATRGWVAVATLWADIESPRGATRLAADRLEQAIAYRVTLRWREGVTGAMRLRLGARILLIKAARDPDESRRSLVLDCEEATP
ncbi:MAG: phage head closure protein [Rhodoblastus sp.]|nr:MAG: phage head closure protein [Rhodoblastus sp.]